MGSDLDVGGPEEDSLLTAGEADTVRSALSDASPVAVPLPGSPATESDVALVDPHALTIPVTRTPAPTIIERRFIRWIYLPFIRSIKATLRDQVALSVSLIGPSFDFRVGSGTGVCI